MTVGDSASAAFFEDMYSRASDSDPWQFEHSPYERQRYRTLLDMLGDQTFCSAFEPGCSIGVWSRMLAARCEALTAVDFSARAIDEAVGRTRSVGITNIKFLISSFPEVLDQLVDTFDLLCLVEIGYYFDPSQWKQAVRASLEVTTDDATVLLSHWDGSSRDHRLDADTVHDLATAELQTCGFVPLTQRDRHTGFVAELWSRK